MSKLSDKNAPRLRLVSSGDIDPVVDHIVRGMLTPTGEGEP
jgi:hypothetical protein